MVVGGGAVHGAAVSEGVPVCCSSLLSGAVVGVGVASMTAATAVVVCITVELVVVVVAVGSGDVDGRSASATCRAGSEPLVVVRDGRSGEEVADRGMRGLLLLLDLVMGGEDGVGGVVVGRDDVLAVGGEVAGEDVGVPGGVQCPRGDSRTPRKLSLST
jgi:hypothetical protein